MNKKVWFISIGCLVAGLVIGYFGGVIRATSAFADTLALLKECELAELGQRAFQAYQHESKPIAIYALTQDLSTLQNAEKLGIDNPILQTRMEIQRRLMFTHARLAKLLAESGETNASASHIAAALRSAQETGSAPAPIRRFPSITNETRLFETLAKFDLKEVP
jgi:hypothetical protein